MESASSHWRPCSSCKTPIAFEKTYWVCNISTCNRKRTGLVFCSVECWDTHLGVVYHRESYALERRAPSASQWRQEQKQAGGSRTAARSPQPARERPAARPPRRIVPSSTTSRDEGLPREVLIISSKLKAYTRARSDMNTSDAALEPLSEAVRRLCDKAIEKARRAERKTVLARDFD
jgi:histone H3/H4